MTKTLNQMALQMLHMNNIYPTKTANIIMGEDNFILPALVEGQIFYFKFFTTPRKEIMESEVQVVNELRKNGISVPEYFTKDGNSVFTSSEETFDITFYGSKHIDGTQNPVITDELLEEVIDKIAEMHKVIAETDRSNLHLKSVTDYQRIMDFYITNAGFCREKGLVGHIEAIIQSGDEKTQKYPIHADLYFNNILFENDQFKSFIDFSDMRESYFEDDLGKFFQTLLCTKGIEMEQIKELMRIYEQKLGRNISKKDVYISTFYRTMYRYYCQSRENGEIENEDRIQSVLAHLVECIAVEDRVVKEKDEEEK